MSYADFSFTALWARIGGAADAALAAAGKAPRGIVTALPEAERMALTTQVAPFATELEQLRRTTLTTIDSRARLMVPLAGGVVFLGLLLAGQSAVSAVIFGLLGAVAGWLLAVGNRASAYQSAVRARFAPAVSAGLSGFDHAVAPQTDLARLQAWQLFPDLQSAETRDRITGTRDGRSLSLTEMTIVYARKRTDSSHDHALSVSVVELAANTPDGVLIALTPKDAPPRLLAAQGRSRDQVALSTGDAAFDDVYVLRSNDPGAVNLLSAEMRGAILELGRIAPAGRPYLVILPGYMAVLFPTKLADLAFHVPPYWVALDADAVLAQFASDLAGRNALLNAVLDLPQWTGPA